MSSYFEYGWPRYVSRAERRLGALRATAKLQRKGRQVSPVVIRGRAIAATFWGKSWCTNLERYSDYSNRLPRGRNYVRHGAVIDLQIAPGAVNALVSGTDVYEVAIRVVPVSRARWAAVCSDCAGAIDSLVELLQGHFSRGVMERLCRERTGLFPAPAEIRFACSCPDGARMCKHVAAVLYGVGARLDEEPELLFRLRSVKAEDLVAKAGKALPRSRSSKRPARERILASGGLSELFGVELGSSGEEPEKKVTRSRRKAVGGRGAGKVGGGGKRKALKARGRGKKAARVGTVRGNKHTR